MDDFLRVFLEIPRQEGLRAAQLLLVSQAALNFEVDQLLLVLLNQKNSVVSTLRKKILAHRTDNSICIPAGLRVGVKKISIVQRTFLRPKNFDEALKHFDFSIPKNQS